MPDLPTFDELYAAGKTEMQARNPDITDFREGSNADAIVGSGAVLADEAIAYAVDEFAEQFFDTAEGDALDALILDRFGTDLERKAASASVGTLTFTRSAAVPTGNVPIPSGTVCQAEVDGVSVNFTTDSAVTILDGNSSADVDATCVSTGTAGNVAIGVIDDVMSSVPADPDVTVANAARFTGGAPKETDAALRSRVRRYYLTLRKGTVEALREGALAVPGVEFATVDESYILPADGGYVAVYVGDPDAQANAALVALVETALEDYRAAGIQVQASAAEREEIDLKLELKVLRGADQPTIREDAAENVLAYTDALAVGETLRLARVQSAALHVSEMVVGVEIDDPTADYSPSANNYAVRVNTGDLIITFTEVTS